MNLNSIHISSVVGRAKVWLPKIAVLTIWLNIAAYGGHVATHAERELFAAVNQARQARGLPPLRWDDSLALAARRHAVVMAEHGTAQHSFAGEPGLSARVKQTGARFAWLAENVMQGSSAAYIHAQFIGSTNHRGNILDKDMDSVGVGVIERNGRLFVVEDFSQTR
jgi:uncharacterized protein YkwD